MVGGRLLALRLLVLVPRTIVLLFLTLVRADRRLNCILDLVNVDRVDTELRDHFIDHTIGCILHDVELKGGL